MGGTTKEEINETLRKTCVGSMKYGDTMAIFIDKIVPDFNGALSAPEVFPIAEVFDQPTWRANDTYKKIVKHEENTDKFNGQGNYMLDDKYKICILAAQDQDAIADI